MIRGFGRETFSTYCQTLNRCELLNDFKKHLKERIRFSICGHFLVSRICDAGCSERCFKCAKFHTLIIRYHKKCCCIKTSRQWPWKSESAKECVTTHVTNAIALKINGAESV